MIDLDHLAVAAAPAGIDDGAGRGRVDRLAGVAAEIEAGMHRRDVQERIDAHAEGGAQVDFAGHRLAHRHVDERAAELLGLCARDVHARQRALEAVAFAGQLDRNERAAARRPAPAVELEPEIGEHAAQLARFAFVALLHLRERGGLAPLDAIERRLDACKLCADVGIFAGLAGCRRPVEIERTSAGRDFAAPRAGRAMRHSPLV